MTQTITLSPPAIAESSIACAECPFFKDYQDARGRGWCECFELVTRKHHRSTPTCDLLIQKQQAKTYTVSVQLITEEEEDNGEGYPVPVGDCVIKLDIPELNEETVERAIATRDDLKGYRMMSFWQPVDDDDII